MADADKITTRGGAGLVALAAVFVFWALMATAVAMLTGGSGGGVRVVVFAPGTTGDDALARIVRGGGLPLRPLVGGSVWLVRATDGIAPSRLSDSGAWATFPPPPLGLTAAGCAGVGVAVDRPLPQTMGR